MQETLKNYIPITAINQVVDLLKYDNLTLKIKSERKTRHGDYKRLRNGKHQITVNSNLNKYRFLITLLHEIAHFEAYNNYGKKIKPHGKEWKLTFQHVMLPFLNPEIFPIQLLPLLANHFKNPKASSDTDIKLARALIQFDEPNNKSFIFEIPMGATFKMYNGRMFKKIGKRTKRFECIEIPSGKMYLFNPNAEVEIVSSNQSA